MTKDSNYSRYNAWFRKVNPLPIERQFRVFDNYFRRNYLAYMPKTRGARILELGCGRGQFLHFLRSEGYTNVVAIDLDPEHVAQCRGFGYEVSVADMNAFIPTCEDASFDMVVMNDLIEHVARTEAVTLLEAIRVKLRPGGRLFIKTCNCNNPLGMATFFSDFTHLEGYAPLKLEHLAAITGYVDCSCSNLITYPNIILIDPIYAALFQASWLWKRIMFTANGKVADRVFSKGFLAVLKAPASP